ncbi:uncharacterized protein Tco025E_09551 [Trypanosoma conorhini]|uniref:Uncharacterized protein n=1 Tax=Trypanosoma conorhini TaxID=83891 RepID=A0A3R7KB15_9TRYP|nr:uncharacterized protein Tco025E_09551 [Trypanosoma conorhini]RNE97078.1 hypothetical protein Tco025E_09551 [Trypanosoma conorhini]
MWLRSPWGCFALPQPRGEGLADSPACLFGCLQRHRGVKCGAPTAAALPRVAAERTRVARRTGGLTVGPTAGTVEAAAARARALLICCCCGARRRMHAGRSGHVFVLFFALRICLLRCSPRGGDAGAPHEEELAAAAPQEKTRAAAGPAGQTRGFPAGTVTRTFAWLTAPSRRCSTVAVGFSCGRRTVASTVPRLRVLRCPHCRARTHRRRRCFASLHTYLRTHARNRRARDAPVVQCRWMAFSQPALAVPCAAAAAVSSRAVKRREWNGRKTAQHVGECAVTNSFSLREPPHLGGGGGPTSRVRVRVGAAALRCSVVGGCRRCVVSAAVGPQTAVWE